MQGAEMDKARWRYIRRPSSAGRESDPAVAEATCFSSSSSVRCQETVTGAPRPSHATKLMPLNEDAQPNEVRHSRKGNSAVPIVRASLSSIVFRGGGGRGRGYSRSNDHSGRGERDTPHMRPSSRLRDWSSTSILRSGEPSRAAHDSPPQGQTPQRGSSSRRRKRHGNQGDKKWKRHNHLLVSKPETVPASPVLESSLGIAQPGYREQTKSQRPPEVRVILYLLAENIICDTSTSIVPDPASVLEPRQPQRCIPSIRL